MDLISVIVPVYKVEAYLDRCVQSIVDQTYTNLEIILVDDGSPDRCPQMCDEWAKRDERIRVVHKENGGLSDARNAGMEIARGEYVAFVDSDDWIALHYVERLYAAIQETGVKLAACGVRFVESETDGIAEEKTDNLDVYLAEEALAPEGWKKIRAVAWNKLYHRLLLEGEAYPVGRHHEDEFFTYRIVDKAQRVVFVDEQLYFYLQRQGSIMRGFTMKRLDALDAYMERLHLLKEKYPVLYRQEKANLCVSLAGFYQGILEAEEIDFGAASRKIIDCRRCVAFSLKDWKHYSWKQRVYICGTGVSLPLFCRLLHKRKGRES